MVKKWHEFVPSPMLVGVELNPGPQHSKHLSEEERWAVINLWKIEKLGIRTIAQKMNIRPITARKLVRKYQATESISNQPGQGRKRKLSNTDVMRVKKKAKSGKSAAVIASEESKRHRETVSERTVRRDLKEAGLRYLVKQEREQLSEAHMQKRREFATRRLQYDWEIVLFTDEKSFWLGAEERKAWQDPNCPTIYYKRRYNPKLQVWGGIGHYFKTKLYFFEKNMDGQLYRQILNARIPPYCSEDCPRRLQGAWIFQQDNDPKHKAGATMELLNEIAPDWMRDYPPNSPDFNIIEDIWSHLDRERKKKRITSIEKLKRELTRIWENLSWETVRKSVASMPRRLRQCRSRGGQRTDY